MSVIEPPISKHSALKPNDRIREKGKGSAAGSGKTALNPSRVVLRTSTLLGEKETTKEDELEWPWTTLVDSSVASHPAVFTSDGSYFFSVVGSTVRIYSVATGAVVSTLSSSSIGSSASRVATGGHSDVVTSAILNPEDPLQLLTASLDGDIKVWNFLDAVLIRTIRIGNPISHMCAHDKFKGQVFLAVSTKQGDTISSSPDKGNTMIYRVSLTPKQPSSSEHYRSSEIVRIGKTKAAVSMGISPSGSWLVVIAGQKAYVSLTSLPESGFTKFVSPEKLTCLAFHPLEDYFATGEELGQIRLWYCLDSQISPNAGYGHRRAQTTTMHWHAHAVASLAFTRNGSYLLSGGEESVLVIWQLQTGRKEFVPRLGSPILTITVRAATENEEEYLLGLADGSYKIVDSGSLSVSRGISRVRLDPKGINRPPHTPIPLAAHMRASVLILPASHPSSLQIYSPSTSVLSELEVSSSNRISRRDEKEIEATRVDFVAVSSSGDWMATVDTRSNDEEFSAEVNLKFWRWDSSTWVLNTRIEHPHSSKKIVAMNFLPWHDGNNKDLLATVGLDGNVKTWCIRSVAAKGEIIEDFWINRSIFAFRTEMPTDACWSSDGSLLVVSFGRQVALYNPVSNLLLDRLTTTDIKRIESVCFLGVNGRYLLASGKNNVVLWDLITRTVCWHFFTPFTIAQALAHPTEELATLIIQPYVEDSAIRSSKILHFTPTSSKPFSLRTLPFRFRAVDWYRLGSTSCSIIGITYSWNVVVCGDDTRILPGIEEAPREIDWTSRLIPKKTLFQDIFGKSALVDVRREVPDVSTVPTSSKLVPIDKRDDLTLFELPSYLAPPVETLFSSLMSSFLKKPMESGASQTKKHRDDDEAADMVVDSEPAQIILEDRAIGDMEISGLTDLFRKHSLDRPMRTNKTNGLINGVHKPHANGGLYSTLQAHSSAPKTAHVSGTNNNMSQSTNAPNLSAPVPTTAGKKRKKSIS